VEKIVFAEDTCSMAVIRSTGVGLVASIGGDVLSFAWPSEGAAILRRKLLVWNACVDTLEHTFELGNAPEVIGTTPIG
jgi:hypothetical protein